MWSCGPTPTDRSAERPDAPAAIIECAVVDLPNAALSQVPAETLDLLRVVDRDMGEWMRRAAVPIYAAGPRSAPYLHGSGTLLQVADARFIVTAKHVAEDLGDGFKLGFGNSLVSGPLTRLRRGWAAPDPHDVAVFPLVEEQIARLEGMTFLRLDEIDVTTTQSDDPGGWYSLFGFPSCWFIHDPVVKQIVGRVFRFGVTLYRGDASVLGNFDPEIHLLFEARQEGAIALEGVPDFPERYGGISGSGVWRIAKPAEQNASWAKERARLVGVQTGVYGRPPAS